MPSVEEIHKLKDYYVTQLYGNVRKEQSFDLAYRDDTFPVPEVREPHKVLRLGVGARMVDAPAEQIITSNPQAYFEITKGSKDTSLKLSKVVNKVWLPLLRLQNPNPFKESLKNKLCRGESYIRLAANPIWIEEETKRQGLPVLFNMLDPMVIYGSPAENDSGWFPDSGVPNNVIVFYERQPRDVILRYPGWSNPKGKGVGDNKENVEWLEYWDKDMRYFEADGEAILTGEQGKNPYGFVPFVRRYSGFGRRSPYGEMADLIVSDLKWNRDLIKELCIMASDISSRMHLSAHKPKTIITPGEVNEDNIRENMSFGAYDLNILQNVPEGTRFLDSRESDISPVTADEFQHYSATWQMLTQRNPFLLAGFPFGTSGRQQGMAESSAMRRYDAPLENTQLEFATAVKMALAICKRIPELKPDGLTGNDLEAEFECSVFLKAEDPVEEDRKITLGERLWNGGQGSIDLRTNLIQFQGRTEDEAEEIIASLLVDKLTIYNPDVAAVMGMVFAEESGMMDFIQKAKERAQGMEQAPGMSKQPTPSGIERLMGETQTQMGAEMGVEEIRGARRPPGRFTRGA